jgi:uncharacterized metal-binding protein YceD (DUF177 family)
MSDLSHVYNLARLGQLGGEITLDANQEERAALAQAAGALAVPKFSARIVLKKLSPTRFEIHYDLAAEVTQACVVTLEPLSSQIIRNFTRELHYTPNLRQAAGEKEIIIVPGEEEVPEEIDSLQYDLAGPLVEEFLLAIDPYPRAPGVEFAPPEGLGDQPESPFAVLKGLKSGG